MKQASKIELLSKLNNKLSGFCKTGIFSVPYSKDASKYLELLYKEGLVSSFKKSNDLLIVTVNTSSNSLKDKVFFEKVRNRPSLKYRDIVRIKSSLKTFYFHTNKGPKTLEQLKQEKLGGIPIFFI